MKDIDENGVDRMERFRGYSQRFIQLSVADEVYRETLEYMKHLRKERDAMRKQRDEAVELYTDLLRRLSGSAPPRAAFLSGDATQKEGGGA